MIKLNDNVKDFNEKLYIELTSKKLVNKVIETKIEDKNYIDFVELFLNDYKTFYLEILYNEKFVINIYTISYQKILKLMKKKKIFCLCKY
jgi:hypothetical protein